LPRSRKPDSKQIEQYDHKDKKRCNNPPVGLVTPETDKDGGVKTYHYDPNLDPHLDPYLIWAGKAEHTSFEVPIVSLHVHERIDPKTIIKAVQRRSQSSKQISLFELSDENPPIRSAIDFYKHRHNWSNRLIAGDSLLVMNSLLEKEGMAGRVQMIYIDPPYGIRYGSNFQPFVNKRDVKDGKDEDLTQEPEMIKAFRDTWELGIHSYLAYLRDRLLLARELLNESGSIFVQISDENVHIVRCVIDEIFGKENFVSLISYATTGGFETSNLSRLGDYIIFYAKNIKQLKYNQLYLEKSALTLKSDDYRYLELDDGTRRIMTYEDRDNIDILVNTARIFRLDNVTSQDPPPQPQPFEFEAKTYYPRIGRHWTANWPDGMERLKWANRLFGREGSLAYVRYLNDYPVIEISNMWGDTSIAGTREGKLFAVQTNPKVIQRCLLMTTDPGDLVLDPTCGSGTTAYVAEQWGRRWITCDTSRIAITLAKQRLMTAIFDYYELAHPEEGVSSGFRYKTVPHITLKSIANNPEIEEGMSRKEVDAAIKKYADQETLYDQPFIDNSKARVTGPFTVEAVPAPVVKPLMEIESDQPVDASISRSGETLRQAEWRDEILKTGIRARSGEKIQFSRVEPLQGTHWLHAEAETREDTPQKAVISFGPEHAPLEQRQVALAIEESLSLVPKPKVIIFAAFEFDPEAAKDIDETNWPGITLLKAKMSEDLLTEDLKKKRASNDSFWLIGQPDILLEKIKEGDDKGKYRVEVLGFDYYNPRTGTVDSGGAERIAMWMLDTDYDGRSLFPRQIFFPMSGPKDGWSKLARNLKAEIDEDLIQAYHGRVSLPFEPGLHERIAVKIVDDRGIESLKLMDVR
jgi:adenine-specific DNA-methyltransferase